MSATSALYTGVVTHKRLRPRAHALRYRVFWLLLDLDEVETADRRLWLLSHNRFNVASFHDADHGDGSATPLRAQIERRLADAGIAHAGGRILLLAIPRVCGYGFNPLSVYFCHRADGRLGAIVYQVHNTFGERHCYVMPVSGEDAADVRHDCDKTFYVSPFLDMDMRYAFRVEPPAERVAVAIRGGDAQGPLIVAALSGSRQALTDRALARALLTIPLLTLKVTAAIHWHALRLWLKGLAIRP